MTRFRTLAVAAVGTLTLTLAPGPVHAVDDIGTKQLRKAVSVGEILEHQRVFQRIANRNGGTRASGTPGYNDSVRYVKRTLGAAGYRIRVQKFNFPFFAELAPAELEQVSPTPTPYEAATLEYSGSGDVTGTLVPIDLTIPPPAEPGSTSGCEASDFPAAPAEPAVALIQRGTCFFEDKARNALEAGYDAVIIFNEGQEGRTDLLSGVTLTNPVNLPVVGLSFADGEALYEQIQAGDDVVVRVATQTEIDLDAVSKNVIASSRGGNARNTVMVGAHLDSVLEGPGINDNGSGTSVILEIAEQMAELGIKPRQKVRFAFWGAEENGLLGSTHYVETRTNRQLRQIAAVLNFDMLGSPNYVRFVYDGNGSGAADNPVGPPGSAQIERVFNKYFREQGLASEPTPFNGRSDYGPFIAVGIPAGGLFSGAEGIKTEEQAEIYGGTAGVAYDACYHEACDDITNLSTAALHELGDAAAHATMTLARTRSGFFEDGSLRTAPRGAKRSTGGAHGHDRR